jgi:hypothetical protein
LTTSCEIHHDALEVAPAQWPISIETGTGTAFVGTRSAAMTTYIVACVLQSNRRGNVQFPGDLAGPTAVVNDCAAP